MTEEEKQIIKEVVDSYLGTTSQPKEVPAAPKVVSPDQAEIKRIVKNIMR